MFVSWKIHSFEKLIAARCNRRMLRSISVPSSQRDVFTSRPTIPIAYIRCSWCDRTFPFPLFRIKKKLREKTRDEIICGTICGAFSKELKFFSFWRILYLYITNIYLTLKCIKKMHILNLIFLLYDFILSATVGYIELGLVTFTCTLCIYIYWYTFTLFTHIFFYTYTYIYIIIHVCV